MKLIYHDENNLQAKTTSKFSEILGEIAKSPNVDIIAPYVSPDILDYYFWGCKIRLLSDFDECFRMLVKGKAKELEGMIKKAPQNFRHIADIHAKVFIGNDLALVGSANLTHKGICERREMALLIDEDEMISELKCWFDKLWEESSEISLNTMERVIEKLECSRKAERITRSFESKAPAIKCIPISLKKNPKQEETEEGVIKRLKDRIRTAPSRDWIENYFDLAKQALDILGDAENDERVVFSCPDSKYISLQINRRIIMTAYPQHKVFLMVGASDESPFSEEYKLIKTEPFRFTKGNAPSNYLLFYETESGKIENKDLLWNWEEAIKSELTWVRKPLPREVDRPILYRLAKNIEFRKEFLDEVFSS